MPRKSSIHFKPVTNIRFAVSHSERTDLSEPEYLLPKEHQLSNIVVSGSLSENDLSALFIKQKEGMTGQAKARGSSPFWEGVVVLPNTNGQEQSDNLKTWKKAYEETTNQKVLHMSIHLDEGYIDTAGAVHYNPHAHVIVSRMDERNRVINLDRKQLAKVQDVTAEMLKMERGSTLAERGGKRGRKHIGHKEFRQQADEKRLELDGEKSTTALYGRLVDAQNTRANDERVKLKNAQIEAAKVPELQSQIAQQATAIGNLLKNEDATHKRYTAHSALLESELAQLKAEYAAERAVLKASGEAKQADYQALKKAYEKALEGLTAAKVPDLVEQLRSSQEQGVNAQTQATAMAADLKTTQQQAAKAQQGLDEAKHRSTQQATEIERLKAEYAAERAALKNSGEAKQADYQVLKKAYEAALADLTATKRKVTEMDDYSKQLKADLIESNRKFTTALREKAEAIEALVESGEKSKKLLKIAQGYRDDAIKIEKIAEDFKAENVDVKAKLAAIDEAYQEEKSKATKQASELVQLKAEYAGYKEAASGNPVPTVQQTRVAVHLPPEPSLAELVEESLAMPSASTRKPVEAPNPQTQATPSPAPRKTLSERLSESLKEFVDWIKGEFGQQVEIDTNRSHHYGPVVKLDDLHAVQKTGRTTYAIHELQRLDKVPVKDDPKMEIHYRNGVGQVKGQGLGKGGRAD